MFSAHTYCVELGGGNKNDRGPVSVVPKLVIYLDRQMGTYVVLGCYMGLVVVPAIRMLRWEKLILMGGMKKFDGQCDI